MRVKKLTVKNIGKIADTTIEFDKPLLLFYGDLCQGKTTLLNAVKYALGGSWPSDIIRHGEEEAFAVLEFEGGSVGRSWYRTKEGTTKDRPLYFVMGGRPVAKPSTEIKKFLNPFLLDNEFLLNMTETERKKYFTELFAVDTSDLDTEQERLEKDARELRATVKAYGEIDTKEVVLLDIESVEAELSALKQADAMLAAEHQSKVKEIQRKHLDAVESVNRLNLGVSTHNAQVDASEKLIMEKKEQVRKLQEEIEAGEKWLAAHPRKDSVPMPVAPALPEAPQPSDTSELDAKIRQGEANKVLHDAYRERLKKAAKKAADEKRLSDIEARQREIRKAKIAKLKGVETGGIKNLSFDENGNFIYEGTQASMLSTSQIMRLSGELSSLYPAGFGLELIDWAESLGRSIFSFIERARREEKSILAAIVGERPANVPEHCGVFVVENGEVRQ